MCVGYNGTAQCAVYPSLPPLSLCRECCPFGKCNILLRTAGQSCPYMIIYYACFPFVPNFPGTRRATDAAIPQVSFSLSTDSIQNKAQERAQWRTWLPK